MGPPTLTRVQGRPADESEDAGEQVHHTTGHQQVAVELVRPGPGDRASTQGSSCNEDPLSRLSDGINCEIQGAPSTARSTVGLTGRARLKACSE